MPMRLKRQIPVLILALLVLTYSAFFGFMSVTQHESLRTHVFDLGNVDQTLWNTVHGRPFHFTTQPLVGENRLGMHVEPILLLLAVLYLVVPDPRGLLIVQTVGLALGAVPLYGLARQRLGHAYTALAFPVAYLLLPALQATNLFEFHAVALAPLFLLTTFYCLERAEPSPIPSVGADEIPPAEPRPRWAWLGYAVCLFLALCCKEDISLIAVLLGLYIVIVKRKWLPGVLTTVAGVLWFTTAVYVIIPHFRPAGSPFLEFYDGLGDNPIAIGWNLLSSPDLLVSRAFTPENALLLRSFLLPLLGMPILGFPFWLLAGPSLAISLFSQNPLMHRMERYHYAAPMIPVMMVSAVYGMSWLSRTLAVMWVRGGFLPPVESSRRERWRHTTSVVLAVLLVGASLWYHYHRGFTPLSRAFNWPGPTAHDRLFGEIARLIPGEAVISAQPNLFPHLSQRERAYFWPDPRDKEYIVLDVSSPSFDNAEGVHEALKQSLEAAGQSDSSSANEVFGWILAQDGYLVLKKGVISGPLPEMFYTFLKPESVQPRYATTVDFGDAIRFLGFSPIYEREEEVRFRLYFQALHALSVDYRINLYLADAQGRLKGGTDRLQPALVWYPTSHWQPGETVEVVANTLPWWTGDLERYAVALGISKGHDIWDMGARLSPRVRESEWLTPMLADGTLLQLMSFYRSWELPYAEETHRQYDRPAVPNSLGTVFADRAELVGYELSNRLLAPGKTLDVTLFWKSLAVWDEPYKVFVHLRSADGAVVAQQDGFPAEGRLPTTAWLPGEYVTDLHRLALADDAPAGKYHLVVGLYHPESLVRLPVRDVGDRPEGSMSGTAHADHMVLAQEVEIVSR